MWALRAGKEARAKVRSAWHVGLEHHMTVKKIELAEAKASADAGAKFMKKWKANLGTKPRPHKPTQTQQTQQQAQNFEMQRNRQKRKRQAEQRRQKQRVKTTQQQPTSPNV